MLSKTDSREVWMLAALLFSGWFFSLWKLGSLALFDLDEGGYAEIAREMVVLNDWIIPRFNFLRLLDKPPLLYWLTAISFKCFGITEFAARMPVALGILGTMSLCHVIGKRFFGALAGFLSAMIFVTSTGVIVFESGRQLQPDMPLIFFLTATLTALLFGCFEPERRRRYFLLGYATMALAVMTKGLLGLVFPFLAFAGYVGLTRDFGLLRQLYLVRGSLIFLLLALPWHLAAELRSPGFLQFYLLDVHFLRYFKEGAIASNMTSLSLPGFWGGTMLTLYPWVVFFPLVIRESFPRRTRNLKEPDKVALWLWLWAGVLLAFFSLGSFRLFYYGLPALPALAILSGRFWAKVIESRSTAGLSDAASQAQGNSVGSRGTEHTNSEAPSGRPMGKASGSAADHGKGMLFRKGILVATLPLVLVAAVILLAVLVPESWHQHLGKELYGVVDTNVKGHEEGLDIPSKLTGFPSWSELSSLAIFCGATLLATTLLALLSAARSRGAWSFFFIVLSMFSLRYCSQVGMEIFQPYVSTKSLATTITSTLQPGERIVMDGLYEDVASVAFYSGQKISLVHGVKKDLAFGSRYPEAAGTFLDEEEFIALWGSQTRIYLLTDYPSNDRQEREAFYSKLRLHYLDRSGAMQLFTNHPF